MFSIYLWREDRVGVNRFLLTARERDCADGHFMKRLMKHADAAPTSSSSTSSSSLEPTGAIDVSQSLAYKAWSTLCIAQNSKLWSMKHAVILPGMYHMAMQGWSHDHVKRASTELDSKQMKEFAGQGMALQQLGVVMMCYWLNFEAPWWQK